ncbi:MAG: sugar phosphate isomerase/epimerase family protein [Phycisphaerales bacterium]
MSHPLKSEVSRRTVLQVMAVSALGGKLAGADSSPKVVDIASAAADAGAQDALATPESAASAVQPAQAPGETAGQPAGRRIQKACKIGMIAGGADLAEKFRIARDAGFDGIEMDSPNAFDVDEVLAARDASGLSIPGVVDSVHWSQPLSHPDPEVRRNGLDGLMKAISDCKAYGGGSVLLVPAIVNKQVSYADAYTRSQAMIREALPMARELDVRISIENVWNNFLLSPVEAARYTDEIDPQIMGWHFDIGNIVAYGWPEHWIRTLAHRIIRLDAKEYSRKKLDNEGRWAGFSVELLEGDCDWPAVMAALDDINYTGGWMAAEVAGGDAERLAFVAERMDRIIAS